MSTTLTLPVHARARARELAACEVVVLYGGRSSEREVSLLSGAAVLAALAQRALPEGLRGPAHTFAVEIESSGAWCVDGERLTPAAALERLPRGAVFFLALHGGEGEDGSIQGLLATQDRTHTGSGVRASALCMNKHATKHVLAAAGIEVARGRLVHPREWSRERVRVQGELCVFGEAGWSVKPNFGGSSVATFLIHDEHELGPAIERVFATGDLALVEARLSGSETTCGVLGNERGELLALTPVEIVPKQGRFFDYEEKYSASGADEFCPPRSLSAASTARLRELAERAHRVAGCDGYSRTDFFVRRDGQGRECEPVALEINTLPGLTARSLLPKAAAALGWSLRDLCLEILAFAIERRAGAVP
jgi:D-alanine-D-alanine ligase